MEAMVLGLRVRGGVGGIGMAIKNSESSGCGVQ